MTITKDLESLIVKTGSKNHGETSTNWVYLKVNSLAEKKFILLNFRAGFIFGGTSYGGPGGYFQRNPVLRLKGKRVLITQYCGYDI